MSEFADLNPIECPLDGLNLIEASAGTGKTWNICGLYVRLLIEKELTVNQILVVTFTKAATAELRDRIRQRIVDMLDALSSDRGTTKDAFINDLMAHLKAQGLSESHIQARLKLARESFDEAAIFTIHGFCQRALGDAPFSAGQPFQLEAVEDDSEGLEQVVQDFWRRYIAHPVPEPISVDDLSKASPETEALPPIEPMTPMLAQYLIQRKDSPTKLAELLKAVLGQPLASHQWPQDLYKVTAPDSTEIESAFDEARTIWQRDVGLSVANSLNEAFADGRLNGRQYSKEKIDQGVREWTDWFSSRNPTGGHHRIKDNRLSLYRQDKLAEGQGTKKNMRPPEHEFFAAAENLLIACEAQDKALEYARLRVLRRLVAEVPDALRQRRRQQRVVSFDDMLANLHRALVTDQGAELAKALRTRFPAALIDEFQDTDPLQFGIFRKIYVPEDEPGLPLFLVGDPKQAIYRFRNADLHTYLLAQQEARHKHSLPNNQRSVPGLIGAGNALFGVNKQAFLQLGINYRPVGLGQKQASLAPLTDKSGEERADFQIWTLRTGDDGVPTREEAKQLAANATVGEIVRLLNAGLAGEIRLGDRELTAGDIAVLVRSHREGKLMRRTLEAQGVACVELSLASVWTTLEAEELERILLAIAEKRDSLLRAALATDLLGGTAETLEALGQDEASFFTRVTRFAGYRDLWEKKGFPVMFRQLLRDEAVESRLLGQSSGERRLTNLLHLGELLASAAQSHEGIDALLRWLHGCRTETTGGEGAQLRLESDSQRVKIVTIHKSKGLEYPVVFCPFLWDGYRNSKAKQPDLRQYYDPAPEVSASITDFDPASYGGEPVKALLRFEDAAESVRLMYVALTRAVYRSYLIAGVYSKVNKTGPTFGESSKSLLNWLVCGNGIDTEDWFDNQKSKQRTPDSINQAWQALLQAPRGNVTSSLAVEPLPVATVLPELAKANDSPVFAARQISRTVEEAWNRGSFSGMIRHRPVGEEGADHDQDVQSPKKRSPKPDDLDASDILNFPQGAFAGNCLHSLFEHADFAVSTQWPTAIDRALTDYPQRGAETVREQMEGVLANVLNTPIPNGAGDTYLLAHVPRADQLRELSFTLGVKRVEARPLNALIKRVGLDVPRLSFRDIQGYLNGAIDLVFRQAGRYYLLDWKSNHLGYSVQDYTLPRLRDEMREHAYSLQSLVYTLALHRFLTSRLPDYSYERDFGGAYYLFVRGVRPDWEDDNEFPTGVLHERTPMETVMAFDQLLRGQDDV